MATNKVNLPGSLDTMGAVQGGAGAIQSTDLRNNGSDKKDGSDRGWLPAPMNVIVQPGRAGNTPFTKTGGNYEASLKNFNNVVGRVDVTDEARNIRKTWAQAPNVTIKNGKLILSGTKEFLKSDTANELRKVFKEMQGYTYNTEKLNEQIEGWNSSLAKMAEDYTNTLAGFNALNFAISQSARNEKPAPLSFHDYLMITNSAAAGRNPYASTSTTPIFVGYDYDKDGGRKPRYVSSKEFFEEFNAMSGDEKRKEWHAILNQANEGDPVALSKMFFLKGESDDGPANIIYSQGDALKDATEVLGEQILSHLANAVDFIFTTPTPTNIFAMPDTIWRLGRWAETGDASRLFEESPMQKTIHDYNAVLEWQNAYKSELTPFLVEASTGVGDFIGAPLEFALDMYAMGVGEQAGRLALGQAISAANDALRATGAFTEFSAVLNATTGKLQTISLQSNGLQVGTGATIMNATGGGKVVSVLIPNAIAKYFPNFSKAVANAVMKIQMINNLGNLAVKSGDDIGVWVMQGVEGAGNFTLPRTMSPITAGANPEAVFVKILTGDELAKWKRYGAVYRSVTRLGRVAAGAAMYNINSYYRDIERGLDVGDFEEYVFSNTAKQVVISAGIMGAGGIISHFRELSKASRIAPTRIVDTKNVIDGATMDSFYNGDEFKMNTYGFNGSTSLPSSSMGIYNEMDQLMGGLMSANGEAFFTAPSVDVITENGAAKYVPLSTPIPNSTKPSGSVLGASNVANNEIKRVTIQPVPNGYNVVTELTNTKSGNKVTNYKFFNTLEEANREAIKTAVPTVHPNTIGNSDLAVNYGNIVKFKVDNRSALKKLPNGTSRARINASTVYLKPSEYEQAVDNILHSVSPEIRAEVLSFLNEQDLTTIGETIFAKDSDIMDAPRLFTPTTVEEARELAIGIAKARAVANHYSDAEPVMPIKTDPEDVNVYRQDLSITERTFLSDIRDPYQGYEFSPIDILFRSTPGLDHPENNDFKSIGMANQHVQTFIKGGDVIENEYNAGKITGWNNLQKVANELHVNDVIDDGIKALSFYLFSAADFFEFVGDTLRIDNTIDTTNKDGIKEFFLYRNSITGGGTYMPSGYENFIRQVNNYNSTIGKPYIEMTREEFNDSVEDMWFDDSILTEVTRHSVLSQHPGVSQDRLDKTIRAAADIIKDYAYDYIIERAQKIKDNGGVDFGPAKYNQFGYELYKAANKVFEKAIRDELPKQIKRVKTKTSRDIVVPATLDKDRNIALLGIDDFDMNLRVTRGYDSDGASPTKDEVLLHIPKNTKIMSFYSSGRREYIVDISSGLEGTGATVPTPPRQQELFAGIFNLSKFGNSYMTNSLTKVPGSYSGEEGNTLADYMLNAKGIQTGVFAVSPRTYLECVAFASKNAKYQDIDGFYNRSDKKKIDEYKEIMRTGDGLNEDGFPVPTIEFRKDGDGYTYVGQEGIHRALAAMELGLYDIPMAVYITGDTNPGAVRRLFDSNEMYNLYHRASRVLTREATVAANNQWLSDHREDEYVEYVVNNPDGTPHRPQSLEYNPNDYMIMGYDGLHSKAGYVKFGEEMLEPILNKDILKKQYEDFGHSIYKFTEPAGPINIFNNVMRRYGGEPKDSLATRLNEFKGYLSKRYDYDSYDPQDDSALLPVEILDFVEAALLSPGDGTYNKKYIPTEGLLRSSGRGDVNELEAKFICGGSDLARTIKMSRKYPNSNPNTIWNLYVRDVKNAVISALVTPYEQALREIGRWDKVSEYLSKDNIHDAVGEIGELILDYPELATQLPSPYHSIIDELTPVVERYTNESIFRSNYSQLAQLSREYGGVGSHYIKDDVDMVYVHRGMNAGGNNVNAVGEDFPFANQQPGDRITLNDYEFTTLNDLASYEFSYGPGHRYLLTIGNPGGTGVFYYGDHQSFTNRVHGANGGAIVLPKGTEMTCVSRVEINDNTTWLTYIRDDADGNPYSGPIDKEVRTIQIQDEITRREVEIEAKTPKNIVVTRNGLPIKWFSDMDKALDFKGDDQSKNIYIVDKDTAELDTPPVTMDNVRYPTVRGNLNVGQVLKEPEYEYKPNVSESITNFNNLMAAMPELKDSPTDYTQGIVEITKEVQNVFTELSKWNDLNAIYEEYARKIAAGEENPKMPDNIVKALQPLTDMLHTLGIYYDPSGKSLTKDFYLPTGYPGNKLVSIEQAINNPGEALDIDHPVDTDLDDILVDPLRVGDGGFWEKRTGELFRDEDGNFTMAKAGTLEENLIAYTISALTRGQNKLAVAANNEVARSKFDRNRHTITVKQAYKGLSEADKTRARIRAAQIKNNRSINKKLKEDKLDKLTSDYTDRDTIDAIEAAYNAHAFYKEIDFVREVNKASQILGYRQTLTMNNIEGEALRFGAPKFLGFRGFSNNIRALSRINVTGTKWVKRYGEWVSVGFGLDISNKRDYEFTRTEPAINLGDNALLMFSPERAAVALYQSVMEASKTWATTGGFDLINQMKEFARTNFRAINDPEKAGDELFKAFVRNFETYKDPQALWLANHQTMTTWIKTNAVKNMNAIIQMADITRMDDRTIDILNEVMAKVNIGTAIYSSKMVSNIQRATYSATLGLNPSPAINNLLSEPIRIIDIFGWNIYFTALKKALTPSELIRVKNIIGDLPSQYAEENEIVGMAENAKGILSKALSKIESGSMVFLQKSEEFKNVMFWIAAEENAKKIYPNDKEKQLLSTLRMFNDTAIAGGGGTTPRSADTNMGRMLFILKNFTFRNWDDFIEMAKKVGYGESGSYKWDRIDPKTGKKTSGEGEGTGGYEMPKGKRKFSYYKAGKFVGNNLLKRYILWAIVLGPIGRSIWDALGGDPTGLSEQSSSRGLYDDESTEEYEGMTPIDDFIDWLPTPFFFDNLKDMYFAARRAGIDTGTFLSFDNLGEDARLQKELRSHLPFGVMTNRVGDMLNLMDRGFSTNSNGTKTYAAPDNLFEIMKGFMLGKSTTANAQAYNKYRYGSVDLWGDLFAGDWLDFAISANPFSDKLGLVGFDSTRKNYNGVFRGSYNDIPTMQAAIVDLRNRRKAIVEAYNQDRIRYTGEFEGLTDSEKQQLAAKKREDKIKVFTEDVTRLVDEFTKAGNALSDQQIKTIMYLFDFDEGDGETEFDSNIARRRYVEAGLPDYNAATTAPKQDPETGKIEEQNYFQRSLIYQNAVQGRYGISRDAASEVKITLKDFKDTYKKYKEKVTELNNKAYSFKKNSSERRKYQEQVEVVQNEYLDKLYTALDPIVRKYGTEVLSSNDVVEELQSYMSSMIPYSSIKKYGLTYSSGNDIVWGQLSDWIRNKWGAGAPTAASDKEITDGIKNINVLLDQGRRAQAKSMARALLDKIARGSVGARTEDVQKLRSVAYE